MFDSVSPDFPDTGDPDFCFKMPRLRDGFGDVESDYDTALLARGGGGGGAGCSRTVTPRNCLQEFALMSPALPVWKELPVREDCGYISRELAVSRHFVIDQ